MSRGICIAIIWVQVALSGCIALHVTSPEDEVEKNARDESVSAAASDMRGIRARIVRRSGNWTDFSLACDGRFLVTQKRKLTVRRSGRRELAFGFFPGFYCLSEAPGGPKYGRGVAQCCLLLVENACLAGIPTFFTLFYGPFSGYFNGGETTLGSITAQGLLGCYKRRCFYPWQEESLETETKVMSVDTYALSNYSISVKGKTYSCGVGKETIMLPLLPAESVVAVKIVSVPSLEGDLGRCVDSLVGQELIVEVENAK